MVNAHSIKKTKAAVSGAGADAVVSPRTGEPDSPGGLEHTANVRVVDTLDAAVEHGVSVKKGAVAVRLRLSDPAMRKIMAARLRRVSTDRDAALRFLQEIGVATPSGRLSKRYGG